MAKLLEISLSHSPSKEYSGLISFKIDWFDLLVVQGTLKRFLQRHNLKASIIWHSVLFMFQFSHLYMTTAKTIVVQSLSRVQFFETMDCSTPAFTVLHHLPELAQTNVQEVSDTIQPSHPLSSLSPPAFNLSHHQGLF